MRRACGTIFAAALLAIPALPLAADEICLTGSGVSGLAGSGFVSLTVQPDGSVTDLQYEPISGWEVDFNGANAPRFDLPALDFPELPAGSIITSATLSFDLTVSSSTVLPDGLDAGVDGSLPDVPDVVTLNSLGCPGAYDVSTPVGTWSPPFPDTLSFVPCTSDEQIYEPDFANFSTIPLEWTVPAPEDFPTDYIETINVGVRADYTITEDFTAAPEPSTAYMTLFGAGLIGLFSRRRRQSR